MAMTWAGTADNQLITGAALQDGAATVGYIVDVAIPPALSSRIFNGARIIAHTNVGSGSADTTKCTTKLTFLSQF